MEEVELVIKLSEKDLKSVRDKIFTIGEMYETTQGRIYCAIANGIPLPKGHGRLIDESTITEVYTDETELVKINGMTVIPTRIVIAGTNAPTIIAEDVESEE